VSHCPGHKNSKGELAEWCVKSHEDGHIISSHGSEAAAKKHLQDMHAHSGATKKQEPSAREPADREHFSQMSTEHLLQGLTPAARNGVYFRRLIREELTSREVKFPKEQTLFPRRSKRAYGYYNFEWQGNDALLLGPEKKTVLLSGKAAQDFQVELERIEDEIPHDEALEAAVNTYIQSYFDALKQ
jgi:hypothetical protein